MFPPVVVGLFDMVQPSTGHAKRVCKIFRSESSRQVGLLQEGLKVWCFRASVDTGVAERKFRACKREAVRVTEFLWERKRALLPKKLQGQPGIKDNVVLLGAATVPTPVMNILGKGPKFAMEPSVMPSDLLALVRQVSAKTSEDNRDRCLHDCGERMIKGKDRRPLPRMKVGPMVQLFNESKLKLLQSHKEGGFVAVPEGLFQERARQAVLKNFRGVPGVELKKVKARAVRLCGQLRLDNLKKSVSGAKWPQPRGLLHSKDP
ncbi:hypothetical protein HPB47_009681 [Ixodes persulcatus]|uniref:Uncharacterized protein n=1 Tax=Ixodes persulcatus TaxID=34615 RepID=A0AC60P150_IXOPE|nr:hypothetical protein HPB47_009681 [Ixodes persulcatus]